jgi:hypothetical protein
LLRSLGLGQSLTVAASLVISVAICYFAVANKLADIFRSIKKLLAPDKVVVS